MYILVGWLAYRSSVNYLYKSYGRKNLIILYKKPLFKSYTLQFLLRPHIIFAIVKAFRTSLKNKAQFFINFLSTIYKTSDQLVSSPVRLPLVLICFTEHHEKYTNVAVLLLFQKQNTFNGTIFFLKTTERNTNRVTRDNHKVIWITEKLVFIHICSYYTFMLDTEIWLV